MTTTYATELNDRIDFQNRQQDDVNLIGPSAGVIARIAAQAHDQYPQYEGHWDGWTRYRIRHRIVTKMGEAFLPGDIVIGHHDGGHLIAYSIRNGIDTAISGGNADPAPYTDDGETRRIYLEEK